MKARWKILIAAGVVLLFFSASLLVTMRVQPENELEACKKSLRDKGEKLEISEVLPPGVPPEENCADAVQMAFGAVPGEVKFPRAMQMVAPGKAMIGWMQPDARNDDFTNSWEDILAEMASYRPTFDLLSQVFDRPRLDYQLDYKMGFAMLLPQLAPFKKSAQLLAAAAICNLHNGDSATAATNLTTLLALVQASKDERTIISQLVRYAMLGIAQSANWELLQATNLTDTQLASLQKSWAQFDFVKSTEGAFLMERALMKDGIEKARASSKVFDETFGSSIPGSGPAPGGSGFPEWDEIKFSVCQALWRASWSYSEEMHLLQGDQIILETLRAMQTNQYLKADFDAVTKRLSAVGLTNSGEWLIRKLELPDFHDAFDAGSLGNGTIRKTLQIETARRVVIAAIALKRFQLKHGKWPQTLDELAPEFFSSVPIDPMDGKPLKYRANTDGTYLLYSVGEDGKDDGGDPTNVSVVSRFYWQNPKARDWVWPQPATDAEIKYFYEHPPK